MRRQRTRKKNMWKIFSGMYDVVYDLFFQSIVIGFIMLIIVSFLSNIRNAENTCVFYFLLLELLQAYFAYESIVPHILKCMVHQNANKILVICVIWSFRITHYHIVKEKSMFSTNLGYSLVKIFNQQVISYYYGNVKRISNFENLL